MRLTPSQTVRILLAHGVEAYAEGLRVIAIPTATKDGIPVECEPVVIEPTAVAVRTFLGY